MAVNCRVEMTCLGMLYLMSLVIVADLVSVNSDCACNVKGLCLVVETWSET